MPSALVAALAAPIREVQSLVGPGWSSDRPAIRPPRWAGCATRWPTCRRPRDGPGAQAEARWSGAGADAAAEFVATTVAAAEALAGRVDQLGVTAQTAAAAVARANERLQAIVEDFEARAAALEPYLDSPGAAEGAAGRGAAIARRGRRRRRRTSGGAGRARRGTVLSDGAVLPRARRRPRVWRGPAMPSMGSGFGGGAPMSPPSGSGGTRIRGSAILRSSAAEPDADRPMPRRSGTASRCGCPTAAPRWRRTPWPPAPFGTR